MFRPTRERAQEMGFGLLLLASVMVGFGVLEIGFRAETADEAGKRVDWQAMEASIGQAHAGVSERRFQPGSTYGHLQFNRFGLRGPDLTIPTPTDVVRLAFLGDSKVMSANYPEDLTLSAQTAAALAPLVPGCRFDYVTIAGPEYDPTVLARIWAEVAPVVRPEIAVVLAGSVENLVSAEAGSDGQHATPPPQPTWVDRVIARSALVRAVQRRIGLMASRLAPARTMDLDGADLAQGYHRKMSPLVAALAATPVLALGYRSRLRADQPPTVQARHARNLQLALPGLTVPEAVALSDFNVAELSRKAREEGWMFADPIAAIPPDNMHFLDHSHFSDQGLAVLAGTIAREIAPHVQKDCSVGLAETVRY